MQNPIRTMAAMLMICAIVSCQKQLHFDRELNPQERCRVTAISNLQYSWLPEDSSSFTKFFYDSAGRISHLVNFVGDTHRYYYSASHIIIDQPQTHNLSGTMQTNHWTETFGLDANGRAQYVTVNNEVIRDDSTVFTYDANGYLVHQRSYNYLPKYNYDATYIYTNGNLSKVVFAVADRASLNFPDSAVFKYTDVDVPMHAMHYMFWDKYSAEIYYSWTGKQNKKLRSEARYYYPWGEIDTTKYSYITGADGVPSIVRQDRTNTGWPGVYREANYINYKCN
jgi:hypothetical protein